MWAARPPSPPTRSPTPPPVRARLPCAAARPPRQRFSIRKRLALSRAAACLLLLPSLAPARRPRRRPANTTPPKNQNDRTGRLDYFAYDIQAKPYLTYGQLDAAGAVAKSVAIDTPAPALLHDFACSERYALFVVGPLIFDLRVCGCACACA